MADPSQLTLKRPFDALSPASSSESVEGSSSSAFATGQSTATTSAAPTPIYQPALADPAPQQLAKKLRLKFGGGSSTSSANTDKQELERRRDAFL